LAGAKIGAKTKIWSGVYTDSFDQLVIGDDVTIGKNVILIASGGVSIGNRSMIGHGSQIISEGHIIPPNRGPMRFSGPDPAPVIIENDVWVAAHVVILPGVRVGQGAVVAAGAVVTKDVPPFAVVGGVPARTIRVRT